MSVTRRQLLTALWGAPLAQLALGCRCDRRVPGELLGQTARAGHRLRDAPPRWESATSEPRRVEVLVVGAGPSGLAAAWKLRRAGVRELLVFELEERIGGTSAWGQRGELAYPWGAHYVPLPLPTNQPLVELLHEVSALRSVEPVVAREECLARGPEERLFIDGGWQLGLYPKSGATPAELDELARFEREIDRWVDYRDDDGRRAFALPSAFCSTDDEVTRWDKVNAETWLEQHGFRSERLRWYVEYACRDDYGATLSQTSAWAMLFYFASRRESSRAESQPFVTWPEGNGAMVRHLAHEVNDALRLGHLVTDVYPTDAGVRLTALDVATEQLVRVEADHVVLALPKFVLARVFRPWLAQPPAFLSSATYGAWLVANLHLKYRPKSGPPALAWDSVIYDSPSLGYIDDGFQGLRHTGPTTWTYYYPLVHDDPREARDYLFNASFDDLSSGVLADLEVAHPSLRDVVESMDIWRWGHAMIRPTPGLIWGTNLRAEQNLGPRVHLAHTDRSGFALFEEAFHWGLEAAREILEARE